ncbi:MAG: YfhO family protein [Lachnospiraceae bacterium]|jgi:uncharacterized membrane protein YfhO
MTDKIILFAKKHAALICFIATNIIFLLLYSRFVLLQNVYIYADIGSDTMAANYPNNIFFSNLIHNGDFTVYSLAYGLGKDITSTACGYLNPLNLILIAFPAELMTIGLIFVTFIKINLISFFGFKFMRHVIGDEAGAFAAALTWTFSSYIVLWGQHYGFCTAMVLFTVCMFFLQLYLEGSRTGFLVLIPMLTLFFITNYFFFYLSGIFMALYVILYSAYSKKAFPALIKKLLGLAGAAVFSLGIGAAAILPILGDFSSSTRTGQLGSSMSFFESYERVWYLIFSGRLLSNNTFGTGDAFSAPTSYYETAMLFTSALFIFALVYLLTNKKTALKTILTVLIACSCLYFRVAAQILGFNTMSQRFSFMICFAEAIAIGFFIKYVRDRNEGRAGKIITLAGAPVIYSGILGVLYFSSEHAAGRYSLNVKAIAICALFAVIYWLILLIYTVKLSPKVLVIGISAFLTAELVVCNLDTLYDRNVPTTEEFANGYYNNGNGEAADLISSLDPGLYRTSVLNKSVYNSVKYNDSLVHGYNGTSCYSSTNPGALVSYNSGFGTYQISDNFYQASYESYYIYTLLGGRYLIVNKSDNGNEYLPDSDLFTLRDETDKCYIYENNNALPFGYIYDTVISSADYSASDYADRQFASAEAFYYTDENEISSNFKEISIPEEAGKKEVFLGDCITEYGDLEYTAENGKLYINITGSSPYIIAELPDDAIPQGRYFEIECDVDVNTYIPLMTAVSGEQISEFSIVDTFISDRCSSALITLKDDAVKFRVNLNSFPKECVLEHFCIIEDTDFSSLEKLKESGVSNISFENNTYSCKAEVSDEAGMLCVPILYNKNWSASVDGQSTPIENINGGLCGIELSEGTHNIEMSYNIPDMTAAFAVSAFFIMCYIALIIFLRVKKK